MRGHGELSMIVAEQTTDMAGLKLVSIADYESIVGASTVDRILSKARDLRACV
jgi:hypothetical protein